jgi:hypothetical protein
MEPGGAVLPTACFDTQFHNRHRRVFDADDKTAHLCLYRR